MSYCEMPEFYDERESVAQKQHQCCECHVPIEAGEKYVACKFKYDGVFYCEKQHMPCYHVARFVNHELKLEDSESDGEGCIAFGRVREALREYGQSYYDDDDNETHEPYGVEQCDNILGFWDGWVSGVKERFECGTGI